MPLDEALHDLGMRVGIPAAAAKARSCRMQGLMQMSLAKETVDLIVLRGGRRIILPANLKVWFESQGKIGGEIDPVAR